MTSPDVVRETENSVVVDSQSKEESLDHRPSTKKSVNVTKFEPILNEPDEIITQESVAVRTEKVYYYYNSKDGQEVTSKDKKVIDSTMQANYLKKDSLR